VSCGSTMWEKYSSNKQRFSLIGREKEKKIRNFSKSQLENVTSLKECHIGSTCTLVKMWNQRRNNRSDINLRDMSMHDRPIIWLYS